MPKEGEIRSAFYLGEGLIIRGKTRITTVIDFRLCEQAVLGQESPLVVFFDGILLHSPDQIVDLSEHRRHCQSLLHSPRQRSCDTEDDELGRGIMKYFHRCSDEKHYGWRNGVRQRRQVASARQIGSRGGRQVPEPPFTHQSLPSENNRMRRL